MMSIYAICFYGIAGIMILSTGLAITRKNLVHAMLYLAVSFLGSGLLFYLLGAPLLAALEVIIYAGAIMVLFLFIVMMLKLDTQEAKTFPTFHYLAAAGVSGAYFLACVLLMVFSPAGAKLPMPAAMAHPKIFGHFLFQRHWLAIEIVSLLLLAALIGVIHLGLGRPRVNPDSGEAP
jgi:NADH-quinone oxidoreductase subunit J